MRLSPDPPVHLYKYIKLWCTPEEFFVDHRIKFTAPAEFDDPLDCMIEPLWPNPGLQAQAKTMLERKRRELGVCSLTDRPLSAAMWALYADYHRGLCLRFSTRANPFFAAAQPVRYQRRYPQFQALTTPMPDQYDHILLTKSSDWRGQREWRLVSGAGPGAHPFPATSLTGVTFGLRTEDSVKERVQNWLKRSHWVEFYQVELVPRTFSLRLQSLPVVGKAEGSS